MNHNKNFYTIFLNLESNSFGLYLLGAGEEDYIF